MEGYMPDKSLIFLCGVNLTLDLQIYVCKTAILDFSKWPPLKAIFLRFSYLLTYDDDDLSGKSHFCFGNKWISDTYKAL